MIIAFAGRRIDAPGAPERFPARNVLLLRERLQSLFGERHGRALVSSAACGADLVAIEAARAIGMRFRIVLPFDVDRFRRTSVADRPGDWTQRYDDAIREATANNDVVVLPPLHDKHASYAAANARLIAEALALSAAMHLPAMAVVASEGTSRGPTDLTEDFARRAEEAQLVVERVSTHE